LPPITGGGIYEPPPAQVEALSAILQELNERFGTDFTEQDKVFITALEEKLSGDAALDTSVKVNTEENARLTFDHVAGDKIQELIDTNFKFYKQINDNEEFAEFFLDWLFDRYIDREEGK
jgi:type I restriction enzyme R subunit